MLDHLSRDVSHAGTLRQALAGPVRNRFAMINTYGGALELDDVARTTLCGEATPGDGLRRDTDEERLWCRVPRKQRELLGRVDVAEALEPLRLTLHHDAPGLVGLRVVAVHLEGHHGRDDNSSQLRAFGGPEHQTSALHDVVDREDLLLACGGNRQATYLLAAQQAPALVFLQHGARNPFIHLFAPFSIRTMGDGTTA